MVDKQLLQNVKDFVNRRYQKETSDFIFHSLKAPDKVSAFANRMMIDIKPKSFISKVYELLEKYNLDEVEVYKKVDISRKLFSKLRNPEYHPGKQTIFKLILGMNLSFKDAKELLEHGGYSFSRSDKQDLVIEYCVINKIFDLIDVNIILDDLDLEIL